MKKEIMSQSKEDSLLLLISVVSSDYTNAINYFELAIVKFDAQDFIKSNQYLDQSQELASKIHNRNILGNVELLRGQINDKRNSQSEALVHYFKALAHFKEINDSIKLCLVNLRISDIYSEYESYAQSVKYAESSLFVYTKNTGIDISEVLWRLAEGYYYLDSTEIAVGYYSQLQEIYSKQNSLSGEIKVLNKLVYVYRALKEYPRSLHCNGQIYTLFKDRNNQLAASIALNNMAYDYAAMGDFQKAYETFEKSLTIGQESGELTPEDHGDLYQNIGVCYNNLDDVNNALLSFHRSLDVWEELENQKVGELKNILARIYLDKRDLYNADLYSKESIESAQKSGDGQLLQECYFTYSQVLRQGNDFIRALEYHEKYLGIRDSLAFEKRVEEEALNQQVINLEQSEKDMKLALADEEMQNLAIRQLQLEAQARENELELLKSERELDQSEKERALQALDLEKERYQAEIRENELQQLEQDREIQDLRLQQEEAERIRQEQANELLQSQNEAQQLEIEKQVAEKKRVIMMLGLFGVIFFFIVFVAIVTTRKNRKLAQQKVEIQQKNADLEEKNEEILSINEEITLQKDIIQEKNQEITDSIQYASRIQNAVIPPEKLIQEVLPESFIFFRPKDIVSGDFYWAAQKDNQFVVAAVDCTGHGVPGAFMSMLGMSFLNEIVGKMDKLESDLMMNELRKQVMTSLHQSGEDDETKDGMDMALLIFDFQKKIVQFTGAMNSLYLIRDGELEEFKADRMPVGSHFRAKNPFTREEIPFEKGDRFYIFSDGFPDQFGGPETKKYRYKPFREYIFQHHEKSMAEQGNLLEQEFDKWKGNSEQIDDVLVMGLRV